MHTGMPSSTFPLSAYADSASMRGSPASGDPPSGPAHPDPAPPLQFDTYRLMRELCDRDWRGSCLQVLALVAACTGAAAHPRVVARLDVMWWSRQLHRPPAVQSAAGAALQAVLLQVSARCDALCMHKP